MIQIFEQLVILFVFLIIGYLLTKKKIVSVETSSMLSKLEVYVFLSAMSLKSFASNCNIEYIKKSYTYILAAVIILAVTIPLSHLLARLFTNDRHEAAVYSYSFCVPNFSYAGFALMQALYGETMLFNMMMFTLAYSLYTYTEGYRTMTAEKSFSFKRILNPVIISIAIGCVIGLFKIPIPSLVDSILTKASACMAPVSMILTGIALAEFKLGTLLKNIKLWIATLIRLLAIPAVAILILKLFNVGSEMSTVIVLTLCMPMGLNTVIFPKLVGKDCQTGAGMVVISNALMLATIPFIMWLATIV